MNRTSIIRIILSIAVPIFSLGLPACIHVNIQNPRGQGPTELYEKTIASDRTGSPCLAVLTCGLAGSGAASKVLLVPIRGAIVERDDLNRNVTPGMIKRQLDKARKDAQIRAVILKVNSPGGAVGATDVIYRQLKNYSEEKKVPVYAHIDTVGASGAYYIAMATKRINARPTAQVGSIGVVIRTFGVMGFMEKAGLQYRSIKSGKHKDTLSPFTELTEEERAHYRAQIMRSYERFLGVIETSRGDRLPKERLRRLADGNVYDAETARSSGLIDSTDYFDEFYEKIKEENGLRETSLIAYMPPGTENINIYDITAPEAPASLEDFLGSVYRLHRNGLYYIWDPGAY